jgi:hypothetical protein
VTTAIVYVQLGGNPSKTLLPFSQLSLEPLKDAINILLTDKPDMWTDFPGELVDISKFPLSPGYLNFEKRNRELQKIAGGYWLNTIKRIFVLEALSLSFSNWTEIIHLESDVYSLLTEDIAECLRCNISTAGIPRFSKERGIASLMYIRSSKSLNLLISQLSELLTQNENIRDDMELLGLALNLGILKELPSLPKDAWFWRGQKYLFDGAAFGQYLFGQDPFHTNGEIITGFKNPDFPIDISLGRWEILGDKNSNQSSLEFAYLNDNYKLANLHVHSKFPLSALSMENPDWVKFINEANGEMERKSIPTTEKSVHSEKLSLITRLAIAKKNGLLRTTRDKILRTFSN